MTSTPQRKPTTPQQVTTAGNSSTSTLANSRFAPSTSKVSSSPNAFEPNNMSTAVGGAPSAHGANDSVNGRNPTIPAIPAVNGGSQNFSNDHNRKASMTVPPTSFSANGGAVGGGAQSKVSGIQFGSTNAPDSPAMGTPASLANRNSSNLSVNHPNPRASSPSNSPSPIPQPVTVSGGRPPSSFQGQGNGYSFGQIGVEASDPTGMGRPVSQFNYGPQQEHMRRGSSQSIHSDVGNPSLPTGPAGRGYPVQGGRGRGYNSGPYPQQMSYSPHQTFRPGPNGRNMQPGYQGRGQQVPYQSSPGIGTRSPAMMNATPGTPQMGQMHMVPGMQGQPNGYYMAPHQGFGIPTQPDPSIQILYNQQYYGSSPMQGGYPNYMPPQSPRPPFQQGGYAPHMQPTYSNSGQPPPSMSRQSSQMSGPERPGSSVGQHSHTPLSTPSGPSHNTRTPSISAAAKPFSVPSKKSAAIQIKNAAGEVVSFSKPPASPANATPTATVSTPTISTPPSRTGSAADNLPSKAPDAAALKSEEDKKKAMQEAVKAKIAEEQAKLKQEKEEAEQKAQMEKEAAEAAEREAAEAKAKAEALEKEAAEAEARKAAEAKEADEKVKETTKAETAPATSTADDEIDFDAIEAEMAALEAEEARREEEYQRKKTAEKEAQRKKEEEAAATYEANMKELERKAEAEEEAREKERGGSTADDAARKMFAELKGGTSTTPASTESPAAVTPAESGTATPVSDVSMPPPARAAGGKRAKVADLTLDTKKPVEPPEPSATLKSLQAAKKVQDISKVSYPNDIASPNPALNANAPANRGFKYDKEFLLQFQSVFKEKPTLDWDARIKDALGDGDVSARPSASARTPSGMGGRSVSNRPAPAANAFGPMGAFGGGRPPLPPGTTSEQRFAASNAALRGAAMPNNPFAQFGRPMGPPMGRTPSNNPLGPLPGSPNRGGSNRGTSRAESKRAKHSAKQQAEENKSMPLTAGMAITALETSTTGWKARSLGQPTVSGPALGGDGYMEADVVQRKVKAALNKMTPEKFEKIADQILEIAAQSRSETDGRTLRQVIQLTFEKATDEAHWAPMYAMFCRKMLESMSPEIKDENIKDKNGNVVTGGNLFRKYLLNRCQEEFERGWKVNLPPKAEGESEEAAMLSDEYYTAAAAKRRGLGLVKFIGELFKLQMLTERIMHECVKKLVDYEGMPDEAEVESLSSLLRTVGKQLDNPESKAQGRMDLYFERIHQTMAIPDLPSRLKFMLMDVVDLRKHHWISKEDNKGPKTIAEIHAEAERTAREAELQRLATQGGRGGGGRMPLGRGDARSFSGYGQVPPPDNSNRVGTDDLRRLGNRNSRNPSSNAGPASLGPPSLLGGRTNSGRRGLGPGGLISRGGDDSNTSSRTGTPPAQKEREKKDESSTNAFSALAALENEGPTSPPSNPASPAATKSQPVIERDGFDSSDKATE